MKTRVSIVPQLELSFEGARTRPAVIRRQRRLRRARWWFDQMRRVVDEALDRSPARLGRPEQIHFALDRNSRAN